jgi:hypothetical protein
VGVGPPPPNPQSPIPNPQSPYKIFIFIIKYKTMIININKKYNKYNKIVKKKKILI